MRIQKSCLSSIRTEGWSCELNTCFMSQKDFITFFSASNWTIDRNFELRYLIPNSGLDHARFIQGGN